MSKATYDVVAVTMAGEVMSAMPKDQEKPFNSCGEAEAWARDLSDSAEIREVLVRETRIVRKLQGKGLIIEQVKAAEEEKKGRQWKPGEDKKRSEDDAEPV